MRAMQLLEEMLRQDIWGNTIAYNTAISACENSQHWQRSVHCLRRCLGPREDIWAQAVSYNAGISACEMCQRWQRAVQLLEETPRKGVWADTVLDKATSSSCEKGQQWLIAITRPRRRLGLRKDIWANTASHDGRSQCLRGGSAMAARHAAALGTAQGILFRQQKF